MPQQTHQIQNNQNQQNKMPNVVIQPPASTPSPTKVTIELADRKIEKRYINFNFKEVKNVVQCYHCGTMLPRDEMFLHMEQNHGKFYSHMCGPPRAYQCSVCHRTMETEKQQANHRCQEAKGPFKCDTCNIIFEWRSELVEHLNSIHSIRAKIDLKAKVQIEKDRNNPNCKTQIKCS